MARPKAKIRREKQFNVSLTAAEFELLHARARAASLRPVDYGRMRLLSDHFRKSRRVCAPPHLDPLLLVSLSRIGNNLNQIAHRLNLRPEPAPPSLEPLLAELRLLLRREAAR